MPDYAWFLIDGGLGVVQLAISLIRRPVYNGHPVQGFVVVAVLGAAIYGTALWATFS